MTRLGATLAILLSLVGLSGAANAAIITFGTRAAFNAALDGNPAFTKTVEGWDGFADGTLLITQDGITYSPSVGTAEVTNTFVSLSSPNTLGRSDLEYFLSSDTMTFTFDDPILAFGISFNTASRGNGTYQLTSNLGDIAPSAYDPFLPGGTGQFAGFISDTAFTSVTVSSVVPSFAYNLDDLTYAIAPVAIPAPGSALLLGVGLLALPMLVRRRRMAA